jgi:uncharacterized glyoxalase superfamily protein PhnB
MCQQALNLSGNDRAAALVRGSSPRPETHPAWRRAFESYYDEPMQKNRSVPADTVLPHIVYQDVAAAIGWLSRTFGFKEHYQYGEPGGPISGAQMHLGDAWFMLQRARPGSASPAQLGCETQCLTVFVDDIEAHFQRTKSAGAPILEDLHETEYGELQYATRDLDGHHWLFSRHARDVSPEEWGARVTGR